MKIKITFNYNGVDYRYTVDEEDVEMDAYDTTWDFDFNAHQDKLIFRVVGDKRFIDGKEIITADNIRILVFRESCPIGPIDFIKNDDGKTIGIQFV